MNLPIFGLTAEQPCKGSHMADEIKGKGKTAQPHIAGDEGIIAA
jgi:hypothetical protein